VCGGEIIVNLDGVCATFYTHSALYYTIRFFMVEYIATSFILIICTAVMLFSLRVGKQAIKYSRSISEPILNIVFFFAYYKVIAYYAFPALLNIITDYDFVRQDNVKLFNLAYLYTIESISWLPWLAAFILISRVVKRGELFNATGLIKHRGEFSKIFLPIWVLVYIGYSSYNLINLAGVYNIPIYIEIVKGLLTYGGPPASVFLIVIGFRYWGKSWAILGLIGLLFSVFTISTRGMIIYSAIFLFYVIKNFAPKRKYFIVTAVIFVMLASSHLFLGGLLSNQINVNDDVAITVDIGIANKKGDRSALKEIEWRFGALTRYSTGFITMYERGEGAGINPIKNSLLGFLPRSLNPDKPIPSTRDGDDLYSQGMYLINREIDGYTSMSMAEFSTGGHSYWEMGWFGVLLLNFISGLYIAICAYYFQRLGAIAIPLMVTLFKPWGFVDPKIWVSDIVMQIYQIILPMVVLIFILNIVRRWKRKSALLPLQQASSSTNFINISPTRKTP